MQYVETEVAGKLLLSSRDLSSNERLSQRSIKAMGVVSEADAVMPSPAIYLDPPFVVQFYF
ncbi:MAG TPA: hypothetical protein VLG16_04740 [Candidatus Saccharimonadales bacterium]|nr:hypothetical protein [Candidatus Saccharimonadales bacterium]